MASLSQGKAGEMNCPLENWPYPSVAQSDLSFQKQRLGSSPWLRASLSLTIPARAELGLWGHLPVSENACSSHPRGFVKVRGNEIVSFKTKTTTEILSPQCCG